MGWLFSDSWDYAADCSVPRFSVLRSGFPDPAREAVGVAVLREPRHFPCPRGGGAVTLFHPRRRIRLWGAPPCLLGFTPYTPF